MTGRWAIHVRENVGGLWCYYEGDADGWMNRYMSFRTDWLTREAMGTDELKPSYDRWFGRIAHNMEFSDWLRRPNVEVVDPGRFEVMWDLARGELGKPVELVPYRGK